jgi:hypothetical protein
VAFRREGGHQLRITLIAVRRVEQCLHEAAGRLEGPGCAEIETSGLEHLGDISLIASAIDLCEEAARGRLGIVSFAGRGNPAQVWVGCSHPISSLL